MGPDWGDGWREIERQRAYEEAREESEIPSRLRSRFVTILQNRVLEAAARGEGELAVRKAAAKMAIIKGDSDVNAAVEALLDRSMDEHDLLDLTENFVNCTADFIDLYLALRAAKERVLRARYEARVRAAVRNMDGAGAAIADVEFDTEMSLLLAMDFHLQKAFEKGQAGYDEAVK